MSSSKLQTNSWKKIWQKSTPKNELKYICREKAYTEIFDRYFPKNSRVLEAGCGFGRYCYYLAKKGIQSYGIEIDNDALLKAKHFIKDKKIKVKLIKGDVRKLPYKANFFNGYISLGVIEHFYFKKDIERVFNEAHRVLKKGGYAFFSIPNPLSLTFWLPKMLKKEKVYHRSIYLRELKKYCQLAQFELVSVRYRDFVHPIYSLSVWLSKKDNNKKYLWYQKIFQNWEKIPLINQLCSGIHLIARKK